MNRCTMAKSAMARSVGAMVWHGFATKRVPIADRHSQRFANGIDEYGGLRNQGGIESRDASGCGGLEDDQDAEDRPKGRYLEFKQDVRDGRERPARSVITDRQTGAGLPDRKVAITIVAVHACVAAGDGRRCGGAGGRRGRRRCRWCSRRRAGRRHAKAMSEGLLGKLDLAGHSPVDQEIVDIGRNLVRPCPDEVRGTVLIGEYDQSKSVIGHERNIGRAADGIAGVEDQTLVLRRASRRSP